ncbi:MAG: hypothetical protein ABEH66_07815 [Halobacteriales archaeon]
MAEDGGDLPTDRRSPVGEPVIRGDESITGQSADEAKRFDPTDPESVAEAVETVRAFATETRADADNIFMLRGAAACAALVRAEGSYKAAAERAGEAVTVSFIRKWSRVHDLPRAIRIHVARGEIAPTAAKHIARVPGEARYQLAWATLDADLTVREVREIASDINDGTSIEGALRRGGVTPGELRVRLPPVTYRELRQRAALEGRSVDEITNDALRSWFDGEDS